MPSEGQNTGATEGRHLARIRDGRQTASTPASAKVREAKDNAAASVGSRKKNRGPGGMDSGDGAAMARPRKPWPGKVIVMSAKPDWDSFFYRAYMDGNATEHSTPSNQ